MSNESVAITLWCLGSLISLRAAKEEFKAGGWIIIGILLNFIGFVLLILTPNR